MTDDNFVLSEKIIPNDSLEDGEIVSYSSYLHVDDVKEFLRRLKESMSDWLDAESINQKIDDLAGDDLK